MYREAPTSEQCLDLGQTLSRLDLDCHLLSDQVKTMYGSDDERAIRAEELCHGLQRLLWALDRGEAKRPKRGALSAAGK